MMQSQTETVTTSIETSIHKRTVSSILSRDTESGSEGLGGHRKFPTSLHAIVQLLSLLHIQSLLSLERITEQILVRQINRLPYQHRMSTASTPTKAVAAALTVRRKIEDTPR